MILAVSITAVTGLLVGAAAGVAIGIRLSPSRALWRKQETDLARLRHNEGVDRRRIEQFEYQCDTYLSERNHMERHTEQLTMALEQAKTCPVQSMKEDRVTIWNERLFRSTIEKNRAAIKHFIESLEYDHISVNVSLNSFGSVFWQNRINQMWKKTNGCVDVGSFNGSPAEVADEIVTWLTTDQTFKVEPDCDSVFTIILDVSIYVPRLPPPQVVTIEVPVISTKFVETRFDVPVYIVVEKDGHAFTRQSEHDHDALPSSIRNEINSIVNDETRMLTEDMRERVRAAIEVEASTLIRSDP